MMIFAEIVTSNDDFIYLQYKIYLDPLKQYSEIFTLKMTSHLIEELGNQCFRFVD